MLRNMLPGSCYVFRRQSLRCVGDTHLYSSLPRCCRRLRCASCAHFVHFHHRYLLLLLRTKCVLSDDLYSDADTSHGFSFQCAFWARARRNVTAAAAAAAEYIAVHWCWCRQCCRFTFTWRQRRRLTALSISIVCGRA